MVGTLALVERWRTELGAGAQRVGWKLGFTTPEAQQRAGVSDPVVGYLTSTTVAGYGARISMAGATRMMVEPEIAIRIGPGGGAEAYAAAMEVVDVDAPFDDLERVLAGNIFHRAVMFGDFRRGAEPPTEAGVLIRGQDRERASVDFDPNGAVRLVSETLREVGEALEPGDRIIAGSLTKPVEVHPGDPVAVDCGTLGRLQVVFTE